MILACMASLLLAAQPVEVEDNDEAFEELVAIDLQKEFTDEVDEMGELALEEEDLFPFDDGLESLE